MPLGAVDDMTIRNLDFLFRPKSVALFGASDKLQSIGGTVMRNLLDGGYAGPIMAVSASGDSVAGVPAYRDAAALPQAPELALICGEAGEIPSLIRELGKRGTKAAVVLTGGFNLPEQPQMPTPRQALLEAARPYMLRVLGPNSMGLLVPAIGLNASFTGIPALRGDVAFVSQSGTLAAAALDWAGSRDIGFSHVIALGDAADVDVADVLDYLGTDPHTRAILLYVEAVSGGRKFLSAARATARNKPLIVLKSARTPEGAQVARRHTGADAGADDVCDAAFRRAGMLRVDSIAGLFAAAETLHRARPIYRDGLVILTNAAGPGVVATDALVSAGGRLAELSEQTIAVLNGMLPPAWQRTNPVDVGGDATAARYAQALKALLDDPAAGSILLIHGPTGVVPGTEIAQACAQIARRSMRNVLACWLGERQAREAMRILQDTDIPCYEMPEAAVHAFLQIVTHRRNQETLHEAPDSRHAEFSPDEAAVRRLLHEVLRVNRARLTEPDAKAVLAAYGIPVVDTFAAADEEEAVRVAQRLGYPIALKMLSPEIEHRAELDGIRLNLESADEVRRAARDVARVLREVRSDASIEGFAVQRMFGRRGAASQRLLYSKLAVRVDVDGIFGPVMRVAPAGLGASPAAVGLIPLNQALARDLVSRAHILGRDGTSEGEPHVDLGALCLCLARVSQLIADHPEIVALEIDPLIAGESGVIALDARIRVAPATATGAGRLAIPPYPAELEQHLELRGRKMLLRPVRPEDASAYAQFIARTEAPDIRYRFFRLVRNLPVKDLARYTQIDYDREMAFVAAAAQDGAEEILGEVRIVADPRGTSAEFAILVRSDTQGLGLGRALMRKIIEYCRKRGFAELTGQILPENRGMIALAEHSGMEVKLIVGEGIALARMALQAGEHPGASMS
jgi:acetyltransferase